MEILKKIWKFKDYILLGVIILLIMSCVNTCNNNSDLQRDINRQHNNIAAITDSLKQYKDELGRTIAEKHAFQLTQQELMDSVGLLKKKNYEYLSYTKTQMGIHDTLVIPTEIERIRVDTILLSQGVTDTGYIRFNKSDVFGNSSRTIGMEMKYYVDSLLHTGDVNFSLNQNIFVETWLERNTKSGETFVTLRTDYPNITFNSGMGIHALSDGNYEKSFRKSKGIGLAIGPSVGFGYDLYNHRLVPNVGLKLTIGFTYTPKIFQWGK